MIAHFRKKPVVIEVEQAIKPGTVDTLEGPMSYEAGDWIIKGIEGEMYSCKDNMFQETYEPVVIITDPLKLWSTCAHEISGDYCPICKQGKCNPPRWYLRAWRWIKK